MNRQLLFLKMLQVAIQRFFAAAWFAGTFMLMGLPWTHSWASTWTSSGQSALFDLAIAVWDRATPPKEARPAAAIVSEPPATTEKNRPSPPVVDGWWV